MRGITRLAPVVIGMVAGLAAVALALLGVAAAPIAGAAPALTPTPTTEPPVFSATLSIAADREQLSVGETLSVTVGLWVIPGCQYPVFELKLKQADGEAPIFSHIDPPGDIITGPLSPPVTWTFRADRPGAATFEAQSFGERYCGDYWNFLYLTAKPKVVTITNGTYVHWLPTISR